MVSDQLSVISDYSDAELFVGISLSRNVFLAMSMKRQPQIFHLRFRMTAV